MIRGVFFDANGVLYSRAESPARLALRLLHARGLGARLSKDACERLETLEGQATIGRISAASYWDAFLRAHGVADGPDRARLREAILAHSRRVEVSPEAAPTLGELKRRGFILGVITDTIYPPEWKLEWLAQAGVAGVLDAVACSTVVGARKPYPAIYLHALARTGVKPAEGAFIGHEARELEGAHALEMTTVAVNHTSGVTADYYARSLADLLELTIFQRSR